MTELRYLSSPYLDKIKSLGFELNRARISCNHGYRKLRVSFNCPCGITVDMSSIGYVPAKKNPIGTRAFIDRAFEDFYTFEFNEEHLIKEGIILGV